MIPMMGLRMFVSGNGFLSGSSFRTRVMLSQLWLYSRSFVYAELYTSNQTLGYKVFVRSNLSPSIDRRQITASVPGSIP